MDKKKKVTIGIICCSIIMLAVVGILIYIHLLPYIRLKKTVDNLLNKQYEYKIDGKVEGMDLPLLGNSFQGKINGEKGKNVVYGDISYKDSTYLKLYADKNGEIIFDPTESHNHKATRNRTLGDGSKQKFGELLIQHEVRVLMTRGVNGVYIYACDEQLREALNKAEG